MIDTDPLLSEFSAKLIVWQRHHGRHELPWQNTRDPYRVWLSEIMLQQTQVATVLGYYERFIQRFPDVAALAAASLDEVLGMWSGLGYYGRARNLHRCAQEVVAEHGRSFPPSSTELERLPGIGRSTAAAIAAFCFGERVAILDGNVKRVLTRLLAFDGDLAQGKHERELWTQATRLLPDQDIERYTQGLMDLGATLCTARSPTCLLCPVQALCKASANGTQERYPVKSRNLKRSAREHVWVCVRWRDKVWLVQRPATGIWAGLWSLPEFESHAVFDDAAKGWPGAGVALPSFTHTLTHLDWTLHPIQWTLPPDDPVNVDVDVFPRAAIETTWTNGRWFTLDEALTAGLPAPLRKLLTSAA